MRYSRIQRLVVAGLGAGLIALGVSAVPAISGAAVKHSGGSTLTVPWGPQSNPTSVFPFYDAYQCTTINIDYWNLEARPGYWFGLGSSIAEQPALSSLNQPVFTQSGPDTVATITTKPWKWTTANSGGQSETQDAQEVVFWLNMDKAQSQQGYDASCGYVPHFGIPDQVSNVTEPDGPTGNTVVITFDGSFSHNWLLNNELSQIDPMPTAWDTTNGSNNAGCSTEAWSAVATDGSDQCSAVFTYLSGLQMNNPIWDWSDGPYRQQSAGYASGAPDGNDVQIANTQYSGPVAAHAVKTIKYVPESSTQTEIAQLQKGKLSSGYVDPNDVKKAPGACKAGANTLPKMTSYTTIGSCLWGVFYWMYNFDNSNSTYQTHGTLPAWADIINQQYIRGAMQQAINQALIDTKVNNGYSVPTFSAIPKFPTNSYATGVTNPYPYSTAKAISALKAGGWNTATTPATCNKSGALGCGSAGFPIKKGTKLTLSVLVPAGDPTVTEQTNDEIAMLKSAKIGVTAKFESATKVQDACFGGQGAWELCGYGGWIYAPDYYPSGEVLFATGSSSNSGGFSSTEMNNLVKGTTIGGNYNLNAKQTPYNTSFAEYSATAEPFLWQPTPSTFGEALKTIQGAQKPNPLGDFNPEYITAI